MEPVLPVSNISYDESVEYTGDISNMTAEEYLAWVRNQSSKMPLVFRASSITNTISSISKQSKYMPEIDAILSCPEDYIPSAEWERETVFKFSELRMNIQSRSLDPDSKERRIVVPQMKDRNAWLLFCFGQLSNPNIEGGGYSEESIKKRKRELAKDYGIFMQLEEGQLEEGEIDEDENFKISQENGGDFVELDSPENSEGEDVLCEEEENSLPGAYEPWSGPAAVKPSVRLLLQFDQVLTQLLLRYLIEWLDDDGNYLIPVCSEWIYALLARLEKPLHRDMVASIRQLYRCCCRLRHSLARDSVEFELQLATLNVIISLTGFYFGQGESYDSSVYRDALLEIEGQTNEGVGSSPDEESTEDSEGIWAGDDDEDRDNDNSEDSDMGGCEEEQISKFIRTS